MLLSTLLVFTLNFSYAVYFYLILISLVKKYSSYFDKIESKIRKILTIITETWFVINLCVLLYYSYTPSVYSKAGNWLIFSTLSHLLGEFIVLVLEAVYGTFGFIKEARNTKKGLKREILVD